MHETDPSQDAPKREEDLEEHERETQRREADERSPEERDPLAPEDDDKPAPPGPVQQPRG
jgi:hypothetical protein